MARAGVGRKRADLTGSLARRQCGGMTVPACRLYLVTPPALPDLAAFAASLEAALSGGDVAALQIRLKDASDAEIAEAVRVLAPIARAKGVAVILNDRPDLAAQLDC